MSRRKNTVTASVAMLLIVLISALIGSLTEGPVADPFNHRPSIHFTDSGGAKGLYLLLEKFLPEVGALTSPPRFTDMEELADGTLLVMDPRIPLGRENAEALDAWVAAGGQLIVACDTDWSLSLEDRGDDEMDEESSED